MPEGSCKVTRRDRDYEEQALEAIGNAAKADVPTARAYAKKVRERLEHGAREYGDDQWWECAAEEGFDKLLTEVGDEATDQTGWILGCLQVLNTQERAGQLQRDGSYNTRYLLMQAASLALQSWVYVQMARDAYLEASGNENLRAPRHARPHGFSDPD